MTYMAAQHRGLEMFWHHFRGALIFILQSVVLTLKKSALAASNFFVSVVCLCADMNNLKLQYQPQDVAFRSSQIHTWKTSETCSSTKGW